MNQNKRKCYDCGWLGSCLDVLTAENPFDVVSGESIEGCPKCFSINKMIHLCDEDECKEEATCGWPSSQGYRRTCHKHYIYEISANH